jgi:hypothetical protein
MHPASKALQAASSPCRVYVALRFPESPYNFGYLSKTSISGIGLPSNCKPTTSKTHRPRSFRRGGLSAVFLAPKIRSNPHVGCVHAPPLRRGIAVRKRTLQFVYYTSKEFSPPGEERQTPGRAPETRVPPPMQMSRDRVRPANPGPHPLGPSRPDATRPQPRPLAQHLSGVKEM